MSVTTRLLRATLWIVAASGAAALLSACEPAPPPVELQVTTTADGNDAAPGDGVCAVPGASGACTLRAAVDEAAAIEGSPVVIQVPAGEYALTDVGEDDTNGGGDLDIRAPELGLTIHAEGRGAVIDVGGGPMGVELHEGSTALRRLAVTGASTTAIEARPGTHLEVDHGVVHTNSGAGITVRSGATAIVASSTVSGNGGAGVVADGQVATAYVTVSDNGDGGIVGAGSLLTAATVVGDQASGADCAVDTTSLGHNLDSDGSCALGADTDVAATPPAIGDLTDDPLPVHEPLASSPVIDAIPADGGLCGVAGSATVDQQSRTRPLRDGCDLGAVEYATRIDLVVDDPADAPDTLLGDGLCTTDAGGCTLRAAIDEVNAQPSAAAHGIVLTVDPVVTTGGTDDDRNLSGDLDVRANVTLAGGGHTIDGGGLDRVLDLHAPSISLTEVVVTGGRVVGASPLGTIGGGIRVDGGALTVSRSTVRDNEILLGHGGGIGARDATMLVESSTIEGNASTGTMASVGGGVYQEGGSVVVRSSTLSGNRADGPGTAYQAGLPLLEDIGGTTRIESSTVADNLGGGAALDATWGGFSGGVVGGTIEVRGSVLDDTGAECAGVIVSLGRNLAQDTSCPLTATGDLEGVEPLLGVLADNGGPTRTHLPFANSPLTDAVPVGVPGVCDASVPDDQRGVARPAGPACDIGSVEGTSAGPAGPLELEVDVAVDLRDAVVGDGRCDVGDGRCTLRAAIDEANAWPGSDTIRIADGVDPTISRAGEGEDANATGDLDVRSPLTIDGDGAVVDGAGLDRILDVRTPDLVVVRDITITGGWTTDTGYLGSGGGISSTLGPLTLEDCTITGNTSSANGGAVISTPALTVRRCSITDNAARSSGGGIHALVAEVDESRVEGNTSGFSGGGISTNRNLSLTDSVVADNTARFGGGASIGIYDSVVSRSEIRGNTAVGTTAEGGGLSVRGSTSITVLESSITDNSSAGMGGGISNRVADLTIDRSTLARNHAASDGGGLASMGTTTVRSSTISSNTATRGGGIAGIPADAHCGCADDTVTVEASTIALNAATIGPSISPGPRMVTVRSSIIESSGDDCDTVVTTLVDTLTSDPSCGAAGTGNLVGDPLLGPLEVSGGMTATHVPGAGSPAIDALAAGSGSCTAALPTDQRGFPRPQGAACDLGSVEQ